MEVNQEPIVRYRANFSVTTKGVYTPDITVEITGNPDEISKLEIDKRLDELYESVSKVAESKGYVKPRIEWPFKSYCFCRIGNVKLPIRQGELWINIKNF